MSVLSSIILLAVGFALLLKGADFFVLHASKLARMLHISEFVIGLTFVAFGTSLPELAVSVTASAKNASGIALGNVVGSNIANIGLVLGVAAMMVTLQLQKGDFRQGLFMVSVSVIFAVFAINGLSQIEGIAMFALLLTYLYQVMKGRKKTKEKVDGNPFKSILLSFIGLGGIILGSKFLVDSAVFLAEYAGVSQVVIGVSIVAVGTSLPELATSLMAAKKKMTAIAVGNVVGSNVFNICGVLGLAAIVQDIPVSIRTMHFEIPVMLGFSLLLLFLIHRRKLTQLDGLIFLVGYISFIMFLFL